MSKELNDVAPSRGEVGTLHVASEVSGTSWVVGIGDPASLEVVRRRKKAKTDRIDARKMVRALRAWDGGDRDAMSPVRTPTVAEEDAKRLLRRRERLVKERLRLANPVDGLLGLHGVSAGDPAKTGFRARLDGPETGCGTELPPRRRLRGRRPGRGTGSGEWTLRGGAGQAARDRRERRPAPGRRAALPGLPQPPGAGRPCGAGAGSPGERRRRPGDRQGRQPDAAKAPGADGPALSKWFREHVGAGDGRAEAGDRGAGAQAAGGAVKIRHRRARAEEDNETLGHPGGPTGPPGNPGKACDRREAWFAAGQPDRIRAWTRRRARRGAATFCLEHPRAALTLPLPTERNDVKAETEPAVERRLTATGKGMPGPAPPRCRKRGDGGQEKCLTDGGSQELLGRITGTGQRDPGQLPVLGATAVPGHRRRSGPQGDPRLRRTGWRA